LDIRFVQTRCFYGHTAIAAAACIEQSLVDRNIRKTLAHTHNAIVGPMSIGATGKAAVIGSIHLIAGHNAHSRHWRTLLALVTDITEVC
jgi:hypothetical protein